MAESEKDLEKVIDEHLKRLYDRYKNNTKVFNATHIGHIAVGIVFLFINDSEIALSAPLWVDPLDPAPKQTIKLYILLLPLPIFLAALIIIFYCWTLPGTFPDLSGFDYVKYVVFYLLSAACFPVGFRRVQQAVRNYLPLEEDR